MPVVFDIIGLVNTVREATDDDGEELEDNPFNSDEDNPLLRMDSIGQIEEGNNDTEDIEETDTETAAALEDRIFLMAWNVRPLSSKIMNEKELIESFSDIEDELKIELSKFKIKHAVCTLSSQP